MAPATVPELISTINQLPPAERARARRRVERAIDHPAVEARAALARLASELDAPDPAEPPQLPSEPAEPAAVTLQSAVA